MPWRMDSMRVCCFGQPLFWADAQSIPEHLRSSVRVVSAWLQKFCSSSYLIGHFSSEILPPTPRGRPLLQGSACSPWPFRQVARRHQARLSDMAAESLMIVAGEVSGDIHAGNLVAALRQVDPDLSFFGVCGEQMKRREVECVASTGELAHMGLVEVLKELPRIRALMKRLVEEARRRRPLLAVLIDSPDFNLRLARRLKALGIPVVLFVSPQLWAWRQGRVRQVRRLAREVLCILPFEVAFYERHGVPARYIGHPLVDDLAGEGRDDPSIRPTTRRLALLPGSRAMEVRNLLPAMVSALGMLAPGLIDEAVLIEAPGIGPVVDEVLAKSGNSAGLARVSGPQRRKALADSCLAWTASGTATLECTLLDVPMIVGYRLKPVSWWLARMLVKVQNAALANLIAGETVVPELLQNDWNAKAISEVTTHLLSSEALAAQRQALSLIRERLGQPGASHAAAMAVLEHVNQIRAAARP